jgi:hypothetical protein
MERATVIRDEIIEQNVHFLAMYLETKNSCLVLLSESEDKLGTLAIAVPKPQDLLGPASSSIILGDRNAISARMFAEYLASKKKKIVLISVYLRTIDEIRARSILMKLLEKVVRTKPQKEEITT